MRAADARQPNGACRAPAATRRACRGSNTGSHSRAAAAQPRRGGTIRVTGSPAVEINPHKLTSNGGIITVFPCLNFLAHVGRRRYAAAGAGHVLDAVR